ncbi:MAG: response regulator [Candidatus Margulisbacteria bacterium]|nr:response regulator [Candidatus Margulisiibacteriota bacterium]
MNTNKNILVIDDEPFICDIFSLLLSNNGYDVQISNSNDKAREFLKKNNFDLILLDVYMKGTSFFDFVIEMKASSEYQHIPMIAVTALPKEIPQKIKPYLVDIIEKPFVPDTLMAAVQSVLPLN